MTALHICGLISLISTGVNPVKYVLLCQPEVHFTWNAFQLHSIQTHTILNLSIDATPSLHSMIHIRVRKDKRK